MSNGSDTGSDTPAQSNGGSTTSFAPTSEADSGVNKPTPNSPPNDTPGGNDTGGSSSENPDNSGQPGGPISVVSQLIETGLGGSDGSGASLNAGFNGNDGLNVTPDNNNNAGFNLSADASGQDGLIIDANGGASDGDLVSVGGLADLAGLVGGTGSLIDADFDQDDGQTAAILDVAGSSDGNAQAAVLGADITAGSSFDIPGSSGLLDGILDDNTLLG